MSNFKLTDANTQFGKTVYNASIIQNIVEIAVLEVEGALPAQGKKNTVILRQESDGIYADVSIVVRHGFNIPEIAYRVQQSVKQSVENMTHFKVSVVDVHVEDVVFCEGTPLEREGGHPEEHEEQSEENTEK